MKASADAYNPAIFYAGMEECCIALVERAIAHHQQDTCLVCPNDHCVILKQGLWQPVVVRPAERPSPRGSVEAYRLLDPSTHPLGRSATRMTAAEKAEINGEVMRRSKGWADPMSVPCSDAHVRCRTCRWPVAKAVIGPDQLCQRCQP